jgi:drug/metabolite transporter (DMT)-like permease
MAIILALLACLLWGIAIYLGGVTTRRLGAFSTLLFAQPLALVVLTPIVVAAHGGPPARLALLYALGAGAAAVVVMGFFYRAMAIGKISIVAPIASCGALLPIVVGLLRGERPGTLQLGGMALALVGIVLVSIEAEEGGGKVRLVAGVGLAAGAAMAYGVWALLIKQASAVDPYWATLLNRVTMLSLLLSAAALYRSRRKTIALPARSWRQIAALAGIGILGTAGDLLFAVGTTRGLLSVVSLIGSMYPLVTVGLATILLKERLVRYQTVGIVSALVGIAFLSAR